MRVSEKSLRVTAGPQLRFAGVLLLSVTAFSSHVSAATTFEWETVVNNSFVVPGGQTETFFSYNQPSVSNDALVVFRARARPAAGGGGNGGGEPFRGVYVRDMSSPGQPIVLIADNKSTDVPQPNNTDAGFNEFPSFPRIDGDGTVAFRGQSTPVWNYTLPDGSDTRTGTSGVYTNPTGVLATGASQLGAVPDFDYFSVPGTAPDGTKFDQFPGAPSPTGNIVTFKGNWTDSAAVGHTGIYFRDSVAELGEAPVKVIAESGMLIPNGGGTSNTTAQFGSTAPPSAWGNVVVFTGLDNEETPTAGGIYMSVISDNPNLQPLVDFSTKVPGVVGDPTFNRVGEALSFDGNKVGFWAAWGTETKTVALTCGSEGNASVIAACVAQSDKDANGLPTGTTTREVPVHQGIFTVDIGTGEVEMVAQTGDPGVDDLLFWNFSGAPPDEEAEADREPPRWRSTSFVAVDGDKTVFKATDYTVESLMYDEGPSSIFEMLLNTTMAASILDSMAPVASLIVALGIERDGFRNNHLAINASFLNAAGESWAGIYLATPAPVPLPAGLPLLASGLDALGVIGWRRKRKAAAVAA